MDQNVAVRARDDYPLRIINDVKELGEAEVAACDCSTLLLARAPGLGELANGAPLDDSALSEETGTVFALALFTRFTGVTTGGRGGRLQLLLRGRGR